jgi:hypothetical protein
MLSTVNKVSTTGLRKGNIALAAAVLVSVFFGAACGSSDSTATSAPFATKAPPSSSVAVVLSQGPTATPPPPSATKSPVANADRKVGGAIGDLAPEFGGIDAWINGGPLTMGELRGSVVLIDF